MTIAQTQTGGTQTDTALPTPERSVPIELRSSPELPAEKAAILFHGMTCTPDELAELATQLHADGFDVFVPCLSGHGTTPEGMRRTTAEQWRADAEAICGKVNALNYKTCVIGGQSFGATLAMWAAAHYPGRFSALVLMSVPLKLRSRRTELLLQALSFLPDALLDRLPLVRKTARPPGTFSRTRYCYPVHAMGAAARIVALRRAALRILPRVTAPILLLQDPNDHHIAPSVPPLLRRIAKARVRLRWFPHGHHELTEGHLHREVIDEVRSFLRQVA